MNDLVKDFRDTRKLGSRLGVVLGAGRSGLAAARLLAVLGARVRLCDANPQISGETLAGLGPRVELVAGEHRPEHFADADLVIVSPGAPVRKMTALQAVEPRKIVSELEFASWFTYDPILAVTGTNGKTTTVSLIGHILREAGKKVFVGGNIGTPLSEFLTGPESADILVLEVSSFQLQNCRCFRPRVGVLLNFAANHLDYHLDMEEYLEAKLNIFARQTGDDWAILPMSLRPDLSRRPCLTRGTAIWFEPCARFEAPGLPGEHNQANVEAAWQAVKCFGVTETQAAAAIRSFTGLPHRIERLGEKSGVLFVDDSKATTIDAVAAAAASFERPVRLLLGGVFKGGDVEELSRALRGRAVEIGLFGASREIFEPVLSRSFPLDWSPTLEAAVKKLMAHSRPGDVILLSPATASFDQYQSYAQRGDDFKRIFEALP